MMILDALCAGGLFGVARGPQPKADCESLPSQQPGTSLPLKKERCAPDLLRPDVLPSKDGGTLQQVLKPLVLLLALLNPASERNLFKSLADLFGQRELPARPHRERQANENFLKNLSDSVCQFFSKAKDLPAKSEKTLHDLSSKADEKLADLKEQAKPHIEQVKDRGLEKLSQLREALPEESLKHGETLKAKLETFAETAGQKYNAWQEKDGAPQKAAQAFVTWIVHGDLPRPMTDMAAWFQQMMPNLSAMSQAYYQRAERAKKRKALPCPVCRHRDCDCEETPQRERH